MNSVLALLGLEAWKPILSALVLPPVPFFVLLLLGARLILPRRGLGWTVIVFSLVGLWLTACGGMAQALSSWLLKPPPALTAEAVAEIKTQVRAKQPVAIVVLGAGMEPLAPEYGMSNLTPQATERLRYGLWLQRATGAPVLFSGGVGWAQKSDGQAEAQVAARIAAQEFGQPLKWAEDQSRDTRENALRTVALLKGQGITRIVLVTHGWHMPRARRVFEEAAAGAVQIQLAPMGLARKEHTTALDWLPTGAGYQRMNAVMHELLGQLLRI
jgi:uncharacterized SAM-binding protein YcdF (DUF218 family)